jgi:hypothetical protein
MLREEGEAAGTGPQFPGLALYSCITQAPSLTDRKLGGLRSALKRCSMLGAVAHACNPGYSGGRDQED